MGKVALLLVASFGVAGATVFFTSKEADVRASATQGVYEADVIAREISRSAYNAGVADVNRHGQDITQALLNFGDVVVSADVSVDEKCANGKPICSRRTGEMLGGTYVVEASANGGNGVEIYSAGTFGYQAGHRAVSKTHRINEAHSVGVLKVKECGTLKIQFVDSMAGYCSSVLLQRTVNGDTLKPEMVYGPGNKRNGEANVGFERFLEAGTQMNFAIGVENTRHKGWKCDGKTSRGALPMDIRPATVKALGTPSAATYDPATLARSLQAYQFSETHFDWIHWALDGTALQDGEPKEGPWAMVETDPTNDQRWRIAFEDQPLWNLAPGQPGYDNPTKSLWATKRYGYDVTGDGKGDGWKDEERFALTPNGAAGFAVSYLRGKDGFHDLRDTGTPADFSDQVIVVEIEPASCDAAPLAGVVASN